MCVFGVSMTSEANRMYLLSVINSIVSGNYKIKLNTGEKALGQTSDELNAQSDIKEQIGCSMPVFYYRPEGMQYESYTIVKETGTASVFYKYKGSTLIFR